MKAVRCWKCSVVADVHEYETIATFVGEVCYMPVVISWPKECVPGLGGHQHGQPPTPEQLVDAGRQALNNILSTLA